jgi:hypothetical protein
MELQTEVREGKMAKTNAKSTNNEICHFCAGPINTYDERPLKLCDRCMSITVVDLVRWFAKKKGDKMLEDLLA